MKHDFIVRSFDILKLKIQSLKNLTVFGTFCQFSNDRINITLIWVWFSNKVLNIKKMKKFT